MRVLFASGIDGFCHRYGVLHWAEQLATQSIASAAWAHTDPRLAAALATHDVLVLYRVPDGAWVRHLLARAAALGRPTVFAVDDLIVVPELTDVPALRGRSDDERRLWHDGVERYRRLLEASDAFLATTEPIAAVGRGLGMPTHLQRCGASGAELALGAAARAAYAGSERVLRLGYFSGTATHDGDLATIAPALTDLLTRHAAIELLVVGPVRLPVVLAPFAARVVCRPLVAWSALPELVASCTASLVPLEWQHPFVAAKGAVKYLEAATVGVPVIASPTDAFRDAVRDGVTGWLAPDLAAWQHALETVVTHPERAAHVGATARADVELRFAPAAQGRELAAFLSTVAAGLRAPHAPAPVAPALAERALVATFPGEVARAAREPAARPDLAAAPVATTAPLGDGAVLAQRFPSRHAGLTRVDVHTITYGLALDHTLDARVRRDDGSEVTAQEIWAGIAPDRDWLAIDLPPEPDSADRTYTLELRAHGTGTRNALSFGVGAPDAGDPCTVDGISGPGPLALRTFAAWTGATTPAPRHAATPA
jgi:glycosyltransferase involved in cell wall biosynthesis